MLMNLDFILQCFFNKNKKFSQQMHIALWKSKLVANLYTEPMYPVTNYELLV